MRTQFQRIQFQKLARPIKKTLTAVAITVVTSTAMMNVAHADAIGLYLGGQVWDSNATGLFGERDQQIDFNLANKQQGSFFIALEHPLPFLPNLKISSTTLDTKGATTLSTDFNFAGTTFPPSSANTVFNTRYIDYTAYYEVFDNDLLTFDFGLTARKIDVKIAVDATTATTPPVSSNATLRASSYVPMFYAAFIFGIPTTDFNVFANGNFLSFKGQTLYDYQAGISYELVDNLAVDVNLTLGYRDVKLELDNIDNLYTNLEFSGAFAGAIVHF
ncbi:MAG: TIGR04219 family outer membrane beta-barrel protein [Alteromonadaceae bacterium]|nr:TIGR04219 family outer membrane beta-barrel protein [Alteromonadaceae bacterium]